MHAIHTAQQKRKKIGMRRAHTPTPPCMHWTLMPATAKCIKRQSERALLSINVPEQSVGDAVRSQIFYCIDASEVCECAWVLVNVFRRMHYPNRRYGELRLPGNRMKWETKKQTFFFLSESKREKADDIQYNKHLLIGFCCVRAGTTYAM